MSSLSGARICAVECIAGVFMRSKTKIYKTWDAMRSRCYNPCNASYSRYGARGIEVCEAWRNSFEAFSVDMGDPAIPSLSIERIDNNGNYEPGNCIWATAKKQARNRSNTRIVECFGEKKCLGEWIEDPRTKVTFSALWTRLRRGWSAEAAITTPPQSKNTTSTRTRREQRRPYIPVSSGFLMRETV